MSVATDLDIDITPPAVMFSHFGINCDDADKLEDFYTRVLGFCVSDDGLINKDTNRIIFMTRRPREHHQFVLSGGEDQISGILIPFARHGDPVIAGGDRHAL